MGWVTQLYPEGVRDVIRVLEYIIDRCDNALANIAGDDGRRELFFELARRAMKYRMIYSSECCISGLVGERLPFSKPVTEIRRSGRFEGKSVEDLIREGVIVESWDVPKVFKELLDKGYAEVTEENLDEALEVVRAGCGKLILVPPNYTPDPLFFKNSYTPRKTDEYKVGVNIGLIKDLTRALPDVVRDELKELISRIEGSFKQVQKL